MSIPLLILYGSATGNSSQISQSLQSQITSRLSTSIFTTVICSPLNDFKKVFKDQRVEEAKVIGLAVVCSTTGNGDSPENAQRFVRFVKKKPKVS